MIITGNKIVLREKRLSDAWNDYTWKTDPELTRLDAAPLLTVSFPQYLADYTEELQSSSSSRHNFAIETLDGKHIGNCGYYGIDEAKGEAEVGIVIGNREYWDRGYGTDAVITLVNYVFCHTSLNLVYLKSLDWNIRAHKSFQKCGFLPWGRMVKEGYNFVLMSIARNRWQQRQAKLNTSRVGGEKNPD